MRKSLQAAGVLLAGSMFVSGCQTVDPYTREEKTATATKGAAIGAIAGAVVGIATGDNSRERRERALIGAGIGGLSGAGIGYYMDQQEAKLRQRLEGTGVSVTRHGENITLNLPSNITFGTNEATVSPSFTDVLSSVGLVLKEYPKTIIEVAGHTDATGSDQYNQLLSERRAEAVAAALRREGVDDRRIIARGYGEQHPIASNATPVGREQNRRVELTLAPIKAD